MHTPHRHHCFLPKHTHMYENYKSTYKNVPQIINTLLRDMLVSLGHQLKQGLSLIFFGVCTTKILMTLQDCHLPLPFF